MRLAHFEGVMRQGIQLFQSGWYGPALARFRQATLIRPASPWAHLWLGRAAYRAKRYAEARQALRRVSALAPGTNVADAAEGLLRTMDRENVGD